MHRASSSTIDEAVKELLAAWAHTRDFWRDQQALAFEREFLEKLPALATQARGAAEEIDAVFRKIHNDCSAQT